MPVPRVIATDRAVSLINNLIELHGPLMFHQTGGYCDGNQPMCFQEGEYKTGGSDICLGQVQGCNFYMSADQYEYRKHTQLILDVTPGRGNSFSLEIPMGVRFYILSVLFSDDELRNLAPLPEPVAG